MTLSKRNKNDLTAAQAMGLIAATGVTILIAVLAKPMVGPLPALLMGLLVGLGITALIDAAQVEARQDPAPKTRSAWNAIKTSRTLWIVRLTTSTLTAALYSLLSTRYDQSTAALIALSFALAVLELVV